MNSELPLISIIIPIYNAQEHLAKCANSVLQQTYRQTQIILVNDGSTDQSLRICRELAAKDKRIQLIDQPNAGASAARNRGLEYAKGEFIQFVDSDDFLPLDYTKTILEEMMESKSDLVVTPIQTINAQGQILKLWDFETATLYLDAKGQNRIAALLDSFLLFGPVNKLYQHNIIIKNNITFDPLMAYGEDLLFNLSYLAHCKKIRITNKVTYYYLQHNTKSSLSHRNQEKRLDWSKLHHKALMNFLIEKDLRTPETDKILFNRMYDGYYNEILRIITMEPSGIRCKTNRIQKLTQDQIWKNALQYPRSSKYTRWIAFLIDHQQIKLLLLLFKIRALHHSNT